MHENSLDEAQQHTGKPPLVYSVLCLKTWISAKRRQVNSWPECASARHADSQTLNEAQKLLPSEGGAADDVATVGTSDDIQKQNSGGGQET